jgi:hypothetical protein
MITVNQGKDELLTEIDATVSSLQNIMSSLDEGQVNAVPYKDSWTAGQLFRHVTKSTNGMSKAISITSKPAERDPGENIPRLRDAFLDLSNKFESPEFIVPEPGPYEKQAAMAELNSAFAKFRENANQAKLAELVEGMPLGPVTKLEILHFVLYHTQRHLHQAKKISDALQDK